MNQESQINLKFFTGAFSELGLPLRKITQIAVDGSNVNLMFLRVVKKFLKEDSSLTDEPEIFEPLCALFILYKLHIKLLTMEQLEHSSVSKGDILFIHRFPGPSRRAEYTHLSGKSVFPLKFCSIRWVENSDVSGRAVQVIPALKTICKH